MELGRGLQAEPEPLGRRLLEGTRLRETLAQMFVERREPSQAGESPPEAACARGGHGPPGLHALERWLPGELH